MNPLFSIIIPTYNSSNTIIEAVESVLNQKYTDFEILIIDGLSTDNTLELVSAFDDDRIKIYSESDKGVYDAMNKGIKYAKGEWLYFMGSDDRLFDTYVLIKIANSIEKSIWILYGDVIMLKNNKEYDGKFTKEKLLEKNICHQSIFYSNKVFKKIGRYNLKYKIFADYEFNIRCFNQIYKKTKYINEVIAYFSDGGLSSQIEDSLFCVDKKKIFLKNGLFSVRTYVTKDLAKSIQIINKNNNNWGAFFLYSIIYFILRFVNIIERRIMKKTNTKMDD